MAFISAIGAAVTGFFASLTWSSVGTFLLKSVASMGLSALAQKLSGKGAKSPGFGVKGQLERGADVPQAFIIGHYATAGSLTYANTNGRANKWMNWVITLSDLPCAGLRGLWVNGSKVTPVPGLDGWTFVDEYIVGDGSHIEDNRIQYRFYDGSQTLVDDWLVSEVSSAERPWEGSAVGTGKAYVVVRAAVDNELFRNGFPNFLFEVEGIPLYNPAKDTSVGGAGAHRWADRATWEVSENPAVQLYNVLRGIRYNGQWFYGLQDVSAAQLPVAHWIGQINKCAASIDGADGPEPLFRSSAEIPVDAEIHAIIENLLTACNGRLSDAGGVYKLFAGAPDAPVMALTDDDIISTSEQSFTPFLGLADTVNGVAAKYPSPVAGWQVETAPPLYRPDFEAQDGGRRLLVNVSLDFVPYAEQAQRLMQAALNEARRARRHTFHLPPKYWPLEPGDVIQWTSVRNGYIAKLFRVDGVIDLPDADVIVDLTEVDPADYDFDTAVDFTPPVIPSTLPQPIPVQEVEGFVVAPASLNDETGTGRRPAIHAIWNGDLADVRSVIFELRVKATSETVDPARSDTVTDGELYISTGILPAVTYEVRAKFIPDSPRPTGWSIWREVTAPDLRIGGDDLATVINDQLAAVDVLADDLTTVEATANGVRQDHDALVSGFLGGDLATAFADVDQQTTELSSQIDDLGRKYQPNHFEDDGKYWSNNISGDPETWGGLSPTVQFRTVANVGRVAYVSFNIPGNTHVAPKSGYLPFIAGNTYRLRVQIRHVGALVAGTKVVMLMRKFDDAYVSTGDLVAQSIPFVAANTWETYEIKHTASGAAAYVLPFIYFPAAYNSPGAEVEVRLLDIENITDTAQAQATLTATLTQNYLTATDTEQAISEARLELEAEITKVGESGDAFTAILDAYDPAAATDEIGQTTNAAAGGSTAAPALGQSGTVLITENSTTRETTGYTNGYTLTIPTDTALQFGARRVKISVMARKPATNGATRFSVAYSTYDTGNSGAMDADRDLSTGWEWYTFFYDVPAPNGGEKDFLGIYGDNSKTGKGTEVARVLIEVSSEAGELPEIATLQGDITGIHALDANSLDGTIFGAMLDQLNVAGNGVIAGIDNFGTAMADLHGNVSASYLLRARAGGQVGELEVVAWNNASGGGSAIFLSAEYIFAKGTLQADLLAVGGNANMLFNTDFEDGLEYFATGASGTAGADTQLIVRSPGVNNWTDGINPTLRAHQNTAATTGYFDIYPKYKNSAGNQVNIPVEPGEYYELSVYVSTHRCTGTIYLQWHDATGAALSAPSATFPENGGSNNDPMLWQRPLVIAQAPSNAKTVRPIFRKHGTKSGSSDSYLFISKPMLAKAHANATQPSTYLPRGTTYVDGQKIIVNTVYADSINVGSFVAAGLAIFGGNLQSDNFDGVVNVSGVITNPGTQGWVITKQGNAAFTDIISRSDLQNGSVSAGGSLVQYTGGGVGMLDAATTWQYLGPWTNDTFWTLAWDFEIRHRAASSTYRDKSADWDVTEDRTRAYPQYAYKQNGVWGAWITHGGSVLSTSQTVWDKHSRTAVLIGNYEDVRTRIWFEKDSRSYNTGSSVGYLVNNVRNAAQIGKAIMR